MSVWSGSSPHLLANTKAKDEALTHIELHIDAQIITCTNLADIGTRLEGRDNLHVIFWGPAQFTQVTHLHNHSRSFHSYIDSDISHLNVYILHR